MDLMKVLQSLEQFLFEVIVWLVFYPRTMWMALTRPLATMRYAEDELGDFDEERYSDALNPPIFLTLTMVLSLVLRSLFGVDEQDTTTRGLLANKENLLAFNILLFSLVPLACALRLMRRKGEGIDRRQLRPPFYAQCYVASPFALAISLAADLSFVRQEWAGPAGLVLFLCALAWFLAVQVRWFHDQLAASWLRSLADAMLASAGAFVLMLLLVLVGKLAA